jgi:hypothetical protein
VPDGDPEVHLEGFGLMGVPGSSYVTACSIMAGIYIVGFFLIQLAPETRHQPLPD